MINIKIIKKKQKRLIKELRSIFEKNDIPSKLDNYNLQMLDANFWQDKAKSKKIIKEKKSLEDLINSDGKITKQLKDLDDLYQLAIEENNNDIRDEAYQNKQIL